MAELHSEAGYLIREGSAGEWKIYKMDCSDPGPEAVILARYTVKDGKCDCEAGKHGKECRHIKLAYDRPKGVGRAVARADAAEIVSAWGDRFARITFDDYVFEDPDEQVVKCVRLKALGRPIEFDGASFSKITGITRAGTFVEVNIG